MKRKCEINNKSEDERYENNKKIIQIAFWSLIAFTSIIKCPQIILFKLLLEGQEL